MATSLEEVVFQSGKFKRSLAVVRELALRKEFPDVTWNTDEGAVDWPFVLLYASALTSIDTERAQMAVLRIATGCLLAADAGDDLKGAAVALLERCGNQVAAELAERQRLTEEEAWTRAPAPIRWEVARARMQNAIPLSSGLVLAANPFQTRWWMEASENDWLSVSAPTSAGKSRIIREYFLEWARGNERFTLVYVVPTRALIEEVSAAFRSEVAEGTAVLTTPWDPDFDSSNRRILVLTQERLHLAQEHHPPFVVDVLFVDEAQSLGGGARGVLLQRTIERASRESMTMKLLFASPLSSNPGLLVEDHPVDRHAGAFTSETVTVNQSLLRVEQRNLGSKVRALSLVTDGTVKDIGLIHLAHRPTTIPLRIALVAHAMAGTSGGNVIYVNGQVEAEKVAKAVFERLPPESAGNVDDDIRNLQELIKTAVHPSYLLADVLDRRVAFHYGNMPLIIRSEVERLFSEGKLLYLVCTSTLLEGVNLPCRTIFMRNPKKGRGNPLTEPDFWNLAGRAGRWGKEFQGNVVCIDTDQDDAWENLPSTRLRSPIRKAVREGLSDARRLEAWLGAEGVRSDEFAESLFSYLCERSMDGVPLASLLAEVADDNLRTVIETEVTRAMDSSQFPRQLVVRHSGIAPTSMQALLESFRAAGRPVAELALPLPEEPTSRARFKDAFVRLGRTMTLNFGSLSNSEHRRQWQLANLVVNWMRGMPLSRLIDQRIGNGVPAAKAIRDVMTDIETVARFQAPKYLACYSDLLAVYAAEQGVHQTEPEVDFTMLLELGVSRPSEVVLMSLGLSRTATIALGEYVVADSWSTAEAVTWMEAQNIEGLDLPLLVQKEIQVVIAASRRRAV